MEEMIDAFTGYRLLTLDHDPVTRTPTVEIAHEALIREWGKLREWLDASREDIRTQRRLAVAAAEWQAGRDRSFLADGARLEQFETFAAETSFSLTGGEWDYLNASIAERERRIGLESQQRARERALERRSRNGLLALVVVLLLATLGALGLTGIAVDRGNAEQQARQLAERSAAEAQSLQRAADSQVALSSGNGDLALILGLEAIKIDDPPMRAQLALSEVAYAPGSPWFLEIDGIVASMAVSPDGRYAALGLGRLFTDQPRQNNNSIQLIDLETRTLVRTFVGHVDTPYALDFSVDGRYIVSGSFDALSDSSETSLIVWNAETGEIVQRFSSDGAMIAWGWVAFTPVWTPYCLDRVGNYRR
jgi:hypothetical protein